MKRIVLTLVPGAYDEAGFLGVLINLTGFRRIKTMVSRIPVATLMLALLVSLGSSAAGAMGLEITTEGFASATSTASASRVHSLGTGNLFILEDANENWIHPEIAKRYVSMMELYAENTEPQTIQTASGGINITLHNPGLTPLTVIIDIGFDLQIVGDADSSVTINLFSSPDVSYRIVSSNENLPWGVGPFSQINSGGFNGALAGCKGWTETGAAVDCPLPEIPIFAGSTKVSMPSKASLLIGVTGFATAFNSSAQTTISTTITVVPIPASAWLFGSALGLLGWVRRKTA